MTEGKTIVIPNYAEVDQNVVGLLKAINSIPGLFTTSSCGGHVNPEPYQNPEGEWEVFINLHIREGRPTLEAWLSIEFLAYSFAKVIQNAHLSVYSPDPFLNGLGDSITFVLEGTANPDEAAMQLVALLLEFQEGLDECLEG